MLIEIFQGNFLFLIRSYTHFIILSLPPPLNFSNGIDVF